MDPSMLPVGASITMARPLAVSEPSPSVERSTWSVSATTRLVGTDTDDSDGWSASVDTTGFAAGTYRYFARATDNESNPSNVVSQTVDVIEPVAEWIVDNGDAGYSEGGSWKPLSVGYQGDSRYAYSEAGDSTATWTISGLASGTYAVYATWNPYGTSPDNAPYAIADGGAPLETVRVNQQQTPDDDEADGRWWELLGQYAVVSGTLTVTLSNDCNGTYVISDAVRVVHVA